MLCECVLWLHSRIKNSIEKKEEKNNIMRERNSVGMCLFLRLNWIAVLHDSHEWEQEALLSDLAEHSAVCSIDRGNDILKNTVSI